MRRRNQWRGQQPRVPPNALTAVNTAKYIHRETSTLSLCTILHNSTYVHTLMILFLSISKLRIHRHFL